MLTQLIVRRLAALSATPTDPPLSPDILRLVGALVGYTAMADESDKWVIPEVIAGVAIAVGGLWVVTESDRLDGVRKQASRVLLPAEPGFRRTLFQ